MRVVTVKTRGSARDVTSTAAESSDGSAFGRTGLGWAARLFFAMVSPFFDTAAFFLARAAVFRDRASPSVMSVHVGFGRGVSACAGAAAARNPKRETPTAVQPFLVNAFAMP
ncbi:hypothetical protein Hesp01_49240 [Herbidospora sp. NBRC 101105]|nr:hypothetical protein Hesp01_49240 [Herbidospora sp. NBRC 101105]